MPKRGPLGAHTPKPALAQQNLHLCSRTSIRPRNTAPVRVAERGIRPKLQNTAPVQQNITILSQRGRSFKTLHLCSRIEQQASETAPVQHNRGLRAKHR